MKVVVTGGGTGGHVFPALEIAKAFSRAGADVQYIGSLRGQEARACEAAGIRFHGFGSEPLYRLTSLRGMRAAFRLAKATAQVRRFLASERPRVIFSTGGYASAPVTTAAVSLGIPFVLHEQNVVPGRTNRMRARKAHAVATVFRDGAQHFEGANVVRTGMPIRPAFRQGQTAFGFAQTLPADAPMLLVMGGSQGAQAINEAALSTAVRMARTSVQWLHVTGPKHLEGMLGSMDKLGIRSRYELRAYLESEEMASAMFSSELAICRSGAGTLAELAAMRKPAILVPYPHAFGDHQRMNAREFQSIGAADLIEERDLHPSTLESRVLSWIGEEDRMAHARQALAEWDVPDSIERIVKLVSDAAGVRAPVTEPGQKGPTEIHA